MFNQESVKKITPQLYIQCRAMMILSDLVLFASGLRTNVALLVMTFLSPDVCPCDAAGAL